MTPFELAAIFLLLVSLVGWVNARWLHWPTATVMVIAGLVAAGGLTALEAFVPNAPTATLSEGLRRLDFPKAVLNYMLGFLLFAGSMQVDLGELRRQQAAVWSLATAGVLISTAIIGGGLWFFSKAIGLPIPWPWAIVFGALISPTDPIAVLAAVRTGGLSKRMEAVLQGEALFNDGVGIVVFSAALGLAASGDSPHPAMVLGHVALEAFGGAMVGLVGGWLTIRAMRGIDEYGVEVALSLALAMVAYTVSDALHVSGPIAVVVAGLIMGEGGVKTAMSDATQRYLRSFWALVDDLLNAMLFLMLGLQVLVIPANLQQASLWAAGVVLVLLARIAVVTPWGTFFRVRREEKGAGMILAWGGLHGALSLALALTLPDTPLRPTLLALTFTVVIFSVVVQGLTFPRLAARLRRT